MTLALGSSCALALHPERKGNNATPIDTGPFVVDLLLLLPGIIPGVIALALDFGTGAIYLNKGSGKSLLGHRSAEDRVLEVRVVDETGQVLDRRSVAVERPPQEGTPVIVALPDLKAPEHAGRPTHLEFATLSGETVSVPLQ